MRKSIKISIISMLLLSMTFCGCGKEEVAEEAITLVDPVSVFISSETPQYRNIYNAKVYSTSVYPSTKEYAFGEDAVLESYDAFPGQVVNAGHKLAGLSTIDLDNQIKNMKEQLNNLDKQYQENVAELNKKITKSDESMTFCAGAGGAYLLNYQDEEIVNKNLKKNLEYTTSIYNLDRNYLNSELKKLQDKKSKYELIASESGTVVAIGDYGFGSNINHETKVLAIGDLEDKQLRCDYINIPTIKKADEVYALFDGKRVEVEYQAMDADEYTKLSKQGASIYTTFKLKDSNSDINVGDFGVIVIVDDIRENVLTVPSSAVHRETAGDYIYVVKDGVTINTPIKTGITDGVYTEILDGLNEDDTILLDETKKYGDQTASVIMGEFSSKFEGYGVMYYPDQSGVANELDYGTMYMDELKVNQYQHVNKGDVICTVHVVQDSITLERYENELKRLKERLKDIEADIPEDETTAHREQREKAAIAKSQEISKVQEKIDELKRIENVTALYADRDGVIVSVDRNLEPQSILGKYQSVVTIANESNCYVALDDPNQMLNYGNMVDVTYISIDNIEKTTQGMIANLGKAGVSQTLAVDWKIIRLPKEVISDMAATVPGEDGWWQRSYFELNAPIREMKNVLIVPKKAVTDVGGHTYVNVIDENGNVKPTSFIAGGFDTENYWVVEGLTEGMKVCLK